MFVMRGHLGRQLVWGYRPHIRDECYQTVSDFTYTNLLYFYCDAVFYHGTVSGVYSPYGGFSRTVAVG